MLKNTHPFPLAAAAASLVGLIFCLWVCFTGGEALCLSNGCELFQDFSLAGVSLWQAGAALFAILLLLAFARLIRTALFCAALALAADAVLLCIMIFTAPCVNCLIAGSIIALCFIFFRSETMQGKRERSPLAIVWLILLIMNAGGALRDIAEPWSPMSLQKENSVHIYFSPSCQACRALLSRAEEIKDASWYPVYENKRDILVISAMQKQLEKGTPILQAVEEAQQTVPHDIKEDTSLRFTMLRPEMLLLQLRLWRNRAHVLGAGGNRLPFLEFHGLPSFLTEQNTALKDTAPPQAGAIPSPPITDISVAGFCDGTDDSPCENNASQGELGGNIDTSGMLP